VEKLRLMAEVLSQQRVSNGALHNLTAEEWLDRYQKFRSACPNYCKYQPEEAVAWHLRQAEQCEASGEWQAADFHLARAAPAQRSSFVKLAVARDALAFVLQKRGMVDEAIKQHRAATRLDPKNAMAHSNLAAALQKKG